MRPTYSLALILCFATTAALADDAPRYALSAAKDGFVRLDTVTGAVSHCQANGGVWRCEPIAGVDDSRLQALAADVARLTADVALLGNRVAALAPPAQAAPPPPPRPNILATAMDRFLDLVRTLKHGRQPA